MALRMPQLNSGSVTVSNAFLTPLALAMSSMTLVDQSMNSLALMAMAFGV